jgi:anti-anti-sigma factor
VVTEEHDDGVRILTLGGRLGAHATDDFVGMLSGPPSSLLLLDLAAVDYISSGPLAALRGAAERMRAAGHELVVCGVTDTVQLCLDLAGVTPCLRTAPDRETALAVKSPPAASHR